MPYILFNIYIYIFVHTSIRLIETSNSAAKLIPGGKSNVSDDRKML